MRFKLLFVFCVAIAGHGHILFGKAEASNRHLAIEDVLSMEGLGNVLFDPSGEWLVYERIPPYKDLDDYSFGNFAQRNSGHQLWRMNLALGTGPEKICNCQMGTSQYLESFSPDGKYLLFFEYADGRLRLGVFDMQDASSILLPRAPAVSNIGEYRPVWISETEFAVSLMPEGAEPPGVSGRVRAASVLSASWARAWRGADTTAQVFRSADRELTDPQYAGSLVIFDVREGQLTELAQSLFVDLQVSPDGRFLAALAQSGAPAAEAHRRSPGFDRRFRLTVFELRSGNTIRALDEIEYLPTTLVWAPDSSAVAGYSWRLGQDFRHGMFRALVVEQGATIEHPHGGLTLVSGQERGGLLVPERPFFLEGSLAVFARPHSLADEYPQSLGELGAQSPGTRPNWFLVPLDTEPISLTTGLTNVSSVPLHVEESSFVISADEGVYRVSTSANIAALTQSTDGRPEPVFPPVYGAPTQLTRPALGNSLTLSASFNGAPHAMLLSLGESDQAPAILVRLPSRTSLIAAGSFYARSVVTRSSDGMSSVLSLVSAVDRSPTVLAEINSHLNDNDYGRWEQVTYTLDNSHSRAADRIVSSCILLPYGFDESRPPPLVLEVYPNLTPRCDDLVPSIQHPFPVNPYLWSARGFAYARVATPSEFIANEQGPIARLPEALDRAIFEIGIRGFANTDDVTLYGHSQGGIAALFAAAHSERYRAVIAMQSWANLFSHFFGGTGISTHAFGDGLGGNMARYEASDLTDFAMSATPFDAPQDYIVNSPVYLAPKISAPVLLVHSDMDYFPIGQFDEMYGALRRAGKDVTYVRYLGEGHVLSSPANIQFLWMQIDEFVRPEPNGMH